MFGGGLDGAMVELLLHLALAGCIETVTIIDEVVLPVWKLCALRCRSSGSEAIFSSPLAVSLQSVNILVTRLLLTNSPSLSTTSSSHSSSSSSLPPRTFEEIQRFQTSAVGCFEDSSFVKLVTHLPFVVALEVALPSGDPLAASCGSMWAGLSKHQSLKVAAFRHSGTIKEVFLRPWWPGGERSAEVSLDGRLIDALKDLVSDGNQSECPLLASSPFDASSRLKLTLDAVSLLLSCSRSNSLADRLRLEEGRYSSHSLEMESFRPRASTLPQATRHQVFVGKYSSRS